MRQFETFGQQIMNFGKDGSNWRTQCKAYMIKQ